MTNKRKFIEVMIYCYITISLRHSPNGIALNPNTNKIYVYNSGSNITSVLDGNANVLVTTVRGQSYLGAVNQNTNMIYIVNLDNTVSVIDGNTNAVVGTINVGKNPAGVAVNPNTNIVYITNQGYDTVSIIKG